LTHCAIRALGSLQVRGDTLFEEVRREALLGMVMDHVPELVVVLVQQDDRAGGLDGESGGTVEDGMLDDLFDAGVGDGGLLLDVDVGTAEESSVEEGGYGGHADGIGFGRFGRIVLGRSGNGKTIAHGLMELELRVEMRRV